MTTNLRRFTLGALLTIAGFLPATAFAQVAADLAIEKTLVGNAVAGGQATFNITVTNNGPDAVTAGQWSFEDAFAVGFTFASSSTADFACLPTADANLRACSFTASPAGDIASGGSVSAELVFDVAADASGSLANTATLVLDPAEVTDGDLTNNVSIVSVDIDQVADLVITAAGAPDPVIAGTDVVWTISVQNDGPSDATNTFVAVDLTTLTYVGDSTVGGCTSTGATTYDCPLGDLAVGDSVTFGIDTTVGLNESGTVSILAQALSDAGLPDPANNTATPSVTVEAASDQTVGFATSIAFTNGNTGTVTAMISCNAGLPLSNSFDISESQGVTFTMSNLPYTTPGTMCEVSIDGVASGYTATGSANGGAAASSCMFDVSNFAVDGANTCEFTATPNVSDFGVDIVFVGIDDPSISQDWTLDVVCSPASADTGPTFGTVTLNTSSTGDASISRQFYADPANGTDCTATLSGLASAIEQDGPCTVEDIAVGDTTTANCTITATAFFEGIPTLSQYGMAIMVLLMLGVGFVGMRRFV